MTKMDLADLENYKLALDQHAIVSVADTAGRIIEANEMFSLVSGYTREELLGCDHRLLNSGHHPKSFFADLWQTIQSGQVWRGNICNRRKDDSIYWVATTIVPIPHNDGRPGRFVSVRTDITKQQNAEKEARGSAQLFRMLTETVDAGVLLHDGGRLIYVNPAIERITGFSQQELLGMEFWQLAHPGAREMLRARGAARLRGEAMPNHYEVRINTKSGVEAWGEITAVATEYRGKPAVLASFVDITERKRAEVALVTRLDAAQAQLLQSEKMASLGQLAAGVAHEINNPIGYVQANISALEDYLGDLFRILDVYADTEQALPADLPARAVLDRMKVELDLDFLRGDVPNLMAQSKEGITRVRQIVQDLKDFSHVDSSKEWKWADLHHGLNSTLNVVNNEIKYRADVIKEYGEIPQIECRPSELNQVFLNLLVNAAHAIDADQRGTITVRTGADAEWLWVEIADTGSGIAPENLKRIFDPFFTTKPVGKGTGLGLSLSYGIVEKHGGRIEVSSELGKGSSFRIILPLRQTPDTMAAP